MWYKRIVHRRVVVIISYIQHCKKQTNDAYTTNHDPAKNVNHTFARVNYYEFE